MPEPIYPFGRGLDRGSRGTTDRHDPTRNRPTPRADGSDSPTSLGDLGSPIGGRWGKRDRLGRHFSWCRHAGSTPSQPQGAETE
jgi:hypothetical protein